MRDLRREVVDGVGTVLEACPSEQFTALADAIAGANRVFVSGAGRSLLFMKSLAMALMQLGYTAHVTGDVTTPGIREGDLLIVSSSSGRTRSVLLFVQQAKEHGAGVALLTASPESPMGELADLVVQLGSGWGQEYPEWNSGSFFELALGPLGDIVIEDLITRPGALDQDSISKLHANLE